MTMIYTVTFNPALDYTVDVPGFTVGMTNRTAFESMTAGGKGINVSAVLTNLGVPTTALGFIAGFTGEEIRRQVESMGIRSDFIELSGGFSRINLKLRTADGTEINGRGPEIGEAELAKLVTKLESLTEGDMLVLAGSVPASLGSSVYANLLERAAEKGVPAAVDATGELLMNTLPKQPFLIKPNIHELGALFGEKLSPGTVLPYAEKLQGMGARNVLVSMGGDGAMLLCEDGEVYTADAPEGKLVSSVGAGDSMVAGFLAGWSVSKAYDAAFHMALAAGSASAFSEGLADRETIGRVYRRVLIKKIR